MMVPMNEALIEGTDQRVQEFLGDAYPRIARFAQMLAAEGVVRGLIGPREVPRLWGRHLLNSAAVASLLPAEGTLVDVGSGAGLPGIVLACMRTGVDVVLLEPMERRATWLQEVVAALQLPSVEVVRARAEEMHGKLSATAVVARAVAPMERLAGWTLPLLETGGVLLAMKGSRAADELRTAAAAISRLGGGAADVVLATSIEGVTPTTVVRVVKQRPVPTPPQHGGPRPSRRRGR
jgi:16S rRNA (guanine527-N7)-methyltransferase